MTNVTKIPENYDRLKLKVDDADREGVIYNCLCFTPNISDEIEPVHIDKQVTMDEVLPLITDEVHPMAWLNENERSAYFFSMLAGIINRREKRTEVHCEATEYDKAIDVFAKDTTALAQFINQRRA